MKIRALIIIYTAIVLGLLFPYGEIVKPLIPFMLSVLVFISFLNMDFHIKDYLKVELIYIAMLSYGIIPAVVFFVSQLFETPLHLGIFYLSTAPPAIASVVMIKLMKGDLRLGISSALIFNMLSPVSISLLLGVYFGGTQTWDIPIFPIFKSLFLIIFIPIGLVFSLQKGFKKVHYQMSKHTDKLSIYLLAVFIIAGVSTAQNHLFSLSLPSFFKLWGLVLSLALFNFLMGGILFKDRETRIASAVSMGQKNTALMLGIASLYLGEEITALVVLYILSHHCINGFLLYQLS